MCLSYPFQRLGRRLDNQVEVQGPPLGHQIPRYIVSDMATVIMKPSLVPRPLIRTNSLGIRLNGTYLSNLSYWL